MQQNSLELAAAIRELEESTAALNSTYDSTSHTSHTSLQCSSGYATMNSTPSGSEDTIASGGMWDHVVGLELPCLQWFWRNVNQRDFLFSFFLFFSTLTVCVIVCVCRESQLWATTLHSSSHPFQVKEGKRKLTQALECFFFHAWKLDRACTKPGRFCSIKTNTTLLTFSVGKFYYTCNTFNICCLVAHSRLNFACLAACVLKCLKCFPFFCIKLNVSFFYLFCVHCASLKFWKRIIACVFRNASDGHVHKVKTWGKKCQTM